VKVFYKKYQQLDRKLEELVHRVGDGSIIVRFDKTKLPEDKKDVVCPHFLELKWAYGCPYNCAWCYLKGTFRFLPKKSAPVIKPYKKTEQHLQTFLKGVKTPEILNAGEIADSLMNENAELPFSKFIIPMFENQESHKVLFLTKSTYIKNLIECAPAKNIITSFSLNAIPVSNQWEKAPPIVKRIEAAKKLFTAGYEVRIRIDPMVPVEDWEKHYLELLDMIFINFIPERITLGSLRGLQSTINNCTDKSWVKYLTETSGWGKKVDFSTRHNMYLTVIEQLKTKYNYYNIALCKETLQMWESIGMDYREIKCNCIW